MPRRDGQPTTPSKPETPGSCDVSGQSFSSGLEMSSPSVDGVPAPHVKEASFHGIENRTDEAAARQSPFKCALPLSLMQEPCFAHPLLLSKDTRNTHHIGGNPLAKRKLSVVHGPLVPPPPNALLHDVSVLRQHHPMAPAEAPTVVSSSLGLESFSGRLDSADRSVICTMEAKDGVRVDAIEHASLMDSILGRKGTDINMPSTIYGTQVASVERKLQGLVLTGTAAVPLRESVVVNAQEQTLPPKGDIVKPGDALPKSESGEVPKPKITSPQILEQHISKIISQNAAIVETLDPLWAKRYMRHSSGTGFPCSESNGKPNGAVRSRKFSVDPSCLSRSKLQSALMGTARERRKTSEGHLGLDLARTSPGRIPGASSSKEVLTRCNVPSVVITPDDSDIQNPEGSIIKDLLLKRRSSKFYQGTTTSSGNSESPPVDEPMHTCPRCKIGFRSRDTLEVHCLHYCKGEGSTPIPPPPWNPEDNLPRKLLLTPTTSNPPPKKRKISEPVLSLSKEPPLVPKRAADDMLADTACLVSRASVLRCSEVPHSSAVESGVPASAVKPLPPSEEVTTRSVSTSMASSLRIVPSYICASATSGSSDAPRRPTSLALQPAALVGSTLVSPETPRPKKQCLQLYINGHAYTYLGLKCSTRSTYCCIYRPQPMYVSQDANPKLSMYSDWRVVPAQPPVPGVRHEKLLSLYDSRQWLHERRQRNAVSTGSATPLVTHSSYWLYRSRDKAASTSEPSESSESDSSRKQSTVSEPETDYDTSMTSPRNSAADGAVSVTSEEGPLNAAHVHDDSTSGAQPDSQDEEECSGEGPKRVKIFEGGFKSNEDYTYVRGRGRGKYVCEECGIRCKKPSMLKKHIRTHTDLRPYSCRHCSFAFKTKGNLTKHMKSKAHHKKCVELGIVPVPTTIDDSQIDAETLAKQEQQRRDNPCSEDDDEDDEDVEDEDSEGADEEYDFENDGVPIRSSELVVPMTCTGTSVITMVGSVPGSRESASTVAATECVPVVTAVAAVCPLAPMEEEQEAAHSLLHLSTFASMESSWHPQCQPRITTAPPATTDTTTPSLPQHKLPISFCQPATPELRLSESPHGWPIQDATSNSSGSASPWVGMGGHRPRSFSMDMSHEQRHLAQQTAYSLQAEGGEYVTRRYSMSSLSENRHLPRSIPHGQLQEGPMDLSTARQRRVEILPGGIISGLNVMSYARCQPFTENRKESESLLGACLQYGSSTTYRANHLSADTLPVDNADGGGEYRSSSPEALWATDLLRSAESAHDEGKCTCGICHKTFPKASQLRMHVNIHYFERPFRCDSCAVSFRTKGHLQKHRRSVSHYNRVNMNLTFGTATAENPRPFKCGDCKIAFRIHGHLAKHLRSKMHILKLECLGKLPFGMYAEMERSGASLNEIDTSDCDNSLESLQVMAQKLYQQPQETRPDVNGELCPRPTEGALLLSCIQDGPLHESTAILRPELSSHVPPGEAWEAPPGARTCPLCNRLLKSAKSLQVHLHCDHGGAAAISSPEPAPQSWPCSLCLKQFPSEALLQQHFVSHTQPRPYVCDRCDAGFTSSLLLANHMATHDQSSPMSLPFPPEEHHLIPTGRPLSTV